ncbi:pentatricopeptide repeat-containing protein At1g12300, mitochondrial-like [Papaver somniferum]|uniref:pentatricopeptide repeat-containing protein At1g12300, mitochondrial-like n=1 Tax=Papaver somniferum TaxID=3469 RepID=UPI000E7055C8|nr:pentatricopeptide repeat-containing protein At1g12300, mitochondrial-like [Papaver somniferum]
MITNIIADLGKAFAIKDLGDLSFFLGVEVLRQGSEIVLTQRKYVTDLLRRTKLDGVKPGTTPLASNVKIQKLGSEKFADPTLYRSVVGALQYLHLTRPDISVAVNKVCQYMHEPYVEHWELVKRIIRYLKHTVDYGLHLKSSRDFSLHAYSDADCAGSLDDRRSTSGYCETDYGFSLFGGILKMGYDPNIITYTNLIKGLCLQGKIQVAVELFDKMIDRGVQPNTITCNTIITGLCRVGELENALHLLRNMAKWNCEASIVSYGVIMDALGKRGLVDEALHLFWEMIDDSSIVTNVIVYNSLINGFCKNLSEAVKVFDNMSNRGVSADSYTYNSLIHGLCMRGLWKETIRYFDEMVGRGISPTIVTFNVLIDSLSKEGRMEEASKIFDAMIKLRKEPDVYTYNSMIFGLCSTGKLEEAHRLFGSVTDKGLQYDLYSFNLLINGYCKSSGVDEAIPLFKEMEKRRD